MRTLDVRTNGGQITPMMARLASRGWLVVVSLLVACKGGDRRSADSTRTLAPVFPAAPGENSNWNADAGPLMIAAMNGSTDSVMVVLPYATDSTIEALQGVEPPISGMTFDLFGRSGKISSSVGASPLPLTDTTRDCFSWPAAKLQSNPGG